MNFVTASRKILNKFVTKYIWENDVTFNNLYEIEQFFWRRKTIDLSSGPNLEEDRSQDLQTGLKKWLTVRVQVQPQ